MIRVSSTLRGSTRRTLFIAAFACLTFMTVAAVSHSAVLIDDAGVEQARINVGQEPLKAYYNRLDRGDGGSAAPILYLLGGEKKHAEKSKAIIADNLEYLEKYIPYMVNIWILRSPGRVVSTLLAYDMTKSSGIYSDDDIKELRRVMDWCISHYLNEGRDHIGKGFQYQTDYIPEDMEDWVIANMNVHRFLAVGLYGLVFPDAPRSQEIIDYTVAYFERILCLGSRPGGAWAENPRYMGGIMRELYLMAASLKNAGERDFFEDDRFKAMLGFFAESIPTPEIEHPHKPTMLAADDSHWWENRSSILGWAASRYSKDDPQSAGEWMWCWDNQGSLLTHESLLFVDPAIERVKPSYGSYLPGMGYVISRDNFAEPDETFFFASFGPELGTANRTMHHAPTHGDFSLIWRGNPLFLTRGCASYVWSRRMRDQVDFARNLVTYDRAGESIEIPEKRFAGPAIEVNSGPDENLVRDYYPDGVMNFVAAESFEYASGRVRNWDMNLPAPFNVRHFITLKPDVYIIWDQIRSSHPLQWNFHMPADDVRQFGNSIVMKNSEGVGLAIDFLQDELLDLTVDWPRESIRADWPMVLSLPYGKGMFVFNALDIARQVIDHDHKGAAKIYENCLSYPSRPKRIGLIETDGQTATVLDKLGFGYELLDYDDLAGDISRFDRIVVGQFAVLVRDRDMLDYREKLWEYVENGGACYWAYQYAWGWKPGDTSGPGYFPKTLMVGEGTSIVWGEGIELDRPVTMHDSPLWKSPNPITPEDWGGWHIGRPDTFKVMPLYAIKPNTDRARNIPVYYSDHWKVLASAKKTYNINVPQTRSRFGPYRWIKVHHEPSDDFLTVLRPFESASGKPGAEILRGSENEAVIADSDDVWRVLTGNHDGFNGNLSLVRNRKTMVESAPLELLLVDVLSAETQGMQFEFGNPATLYCDFRTPEKIRGSLSMLDGGRITLPWEIKKARISGKKLKTSQSGNITEMVVPPGEYSYILESGVLELILKSRVGRIEVVDASGDPVEWVHVFRELPGKSRTQFQGATDEHGCLSMRWDGDAKQKIMLEKGESTMKFTLKPGMQKLTFK